MRFEGCVQLSWAQRKVQTIREKYLCVLKIILRFLRYRGKFRQRGGKIYAF
ncbi:hypothetical protein E2C01_061599 [Portunus trituberculatus]|uniref:Uncharacterized protein n=1 Tax=Portunus trituberculatus TaxID=210409 RepID=A0A5B7HFI7_PORTR|nr:hypothetical protein [Portunus trituberculatus]